MVKTSIAIGASKIYNIMHMYWKLRKMLKHSSKAGIKQLHNFKYTFCILRKVIFMETTCIFGADLVPTPSNWEAFSAGDIDELVDIKLKEELFKANHRIFNLELALCDCDTPIVKRGPSIKAPASTINGIAALKPSLLTLANNHIRDYGVGGLMSTIKVLNDKNIRHIGAGATYEEASKRL